MSSGSSLLRALLEGLVAALSPKQPRSRKSEAGSGGSSPQNNTQIATWRDQASAGRGHDTLDDEPSPGREGNGATRDLTVSELRALRPSYAPSLDGEPDPGEVIWTWVPYVENDGRGKDRPVLIIARLDAGSWAACYLSTKQHRGFVSVGSGPWDSQGRESFLSPERVLRVTGRGMRRESMGVDRPRFEHAIQAVQRWHGLF